MHGRWLCRWTRLPRCTVTACPTALRPWLTYWVLNYHWEARILPLAASAHNHAAAGTCYSCWMFHAADPPPGGLHPSLLADSSIVLWQADTLNPMKYWFWLTHTAKHKQMVCKNWLLSGGSKKKHKISHSSSSNFSCSSSPPFLSSNFWRYVAAVVQFRESSIWEMLKRQRPEA